MKTCALITLLTAMAGGAALADKRTVYRTNYVTVPVVCATLDVADVDLLGGHSYRLLVADGTKPWRLWGVLRPTTNTAARIWVPPASTRPLQWQLVDATPGFPTAAVTKQAPDCTTKSQWVLSGLGNLRPVR